MIKNSTWLVRALARQNEYGFVGVENALEFNTELSRRLSGDRALWNPDCFELVNIDTRDERLEFSDTMLQNNAAKIVRSIGQNSPRIECGALKVVEDGVDAVSSSLLWTGEVIAAQFSHCLLYTSPSPRDS